MVAGMAATRWVEPSVPVRPGDMHAGSQCPGLWATWQDGEHAAQQSRSAEDLKAPAGCLPGAGPTPRGAGCGPGIKVDSDAPEEPQQGAGRHSPAPGGKPVSGEGACVPGQPLQRQLTPIVQQLMTRLRSNAAAAADASTAARSLSSAGQPAAQANWGSLFGSGTRAASLLGQRPPSTPAAAPPASPAGDEAPASSGAVVAAEATMVGGAQQAPGPLPASVLGEAAGGSFDWRRSAARMHLAAAACPQGTSCANNMPHLPAAGPPSTGVAGREAWPDGAPPMAGSRLLAPTASSRARTSSGKGSHGRSGVDSRQRELWGQASRHVEQQQRVRLAVLALIKEPAHRAA